MRAPRRRRASARRRLSIRLARTAAPARARLRRRRRGLIYRSGATSAAAEIVDPAGTYSVAGASAAKTDPAGAYSGPGERCHAGGGRHVYSNHRGDLRCGGDDRPRRRVQRGWRERADDIPAGTYSAAGASGPTLTRPARTAPRARARPPPTRPARTAARARARRRSTRRHVQRRGRKRADACAARVLCLDGRRQQRDAGRSWLLHAVLRRDGGDPGAAAGHIGDVGGTVC